ncbi:hypothetical protein Poli38472_003758 [Pythium oligandrum]|uniref:Protochlorophyllide reductase n=1 Tax=Pythium oligandrum TaxID=41045 RepID=A0A8K1CPF9_PYTOL|nr:hypothetical protein Poli38472_003758 [Pythium oligandrum]|eukprot:TMW65993.1 hypothetical protein Poli38472_003758 [Pythium oligandrum]
MSRYSAEEAAVVPKKWDANEIPSLHQKIVIITGGNAGIGFETALELVRNGATVVLACRNEVRGLQAVVELEQKLEYVPEAGKAVFMKLDVSDLSSVQAFATAFHESYDRLDLLINNAGIFGIPYMETADGLEMQMATNHLGHFALTAQLFDLLLKSADARVVTVSSMGHRGAKYNEDDIIMTRENYDLSHAYTTSKLANLLFTFELTRRLGDHGIRNVKGVACHPGTTATKIMQDSIEKSKWYHRLEFSLIRSLPIFQSTSMGALPTLYAATAPTVKSGQFFGPGGFGGFGGYPALEDPSKQSKSVSAARKLWVASERLTNTRFALTPP